MCTMTMIPMIIAALGLTASGCDEEPRDWGPGCDHLSELYDECIPDDCADRSCEPCE